jgi:hypothetical protein
MDNTGGMFNTFKSNKNVSGTVDFLQSNSMVAKVSFLILVVILFVSVLRALTGIIDWLISPSPTPHLIDGMIDAKHLKVFPQDPSLKGSVPIMRSNNARFGLEFTWSVWVFINEAGLTNYHGDKFRNVFIKGNDKICDTKSAINDCIHNGMVTPNNGPGLYLMPYVPDQSPNDLMVVMNTFGGTNGSIPYTNYVQVNDVPLNKWVNVIIRCENTFLDVFINGTIVKREKLNGVPMQNYDDVYMSMNGGYDGNTSNLWYYDNAIGISEIQQIVSDGPNLTTLDSNMTESMPFYLSLRWFFAGQGDGYNPTA